MQYLVAITTVSEHRSRNELNDGVRVQRSQYTDYIRARDYDDACMLVADISNHSDRKCEVCVVEYTHGKRMVIALDVVLMLAEQHDNLQFRNKMARDGKVSMAAQAAARESLSERASPNGGERDTF